MNTFDWHDYITISSDFSPKEKALLEKSLDSIALAHDGEGEALIRKAAELHHQKIPICPSKGGSGFSPEHTSIYVDFAEIAPTEVKDNGNGVDRHVSLTGFMVHELFHSADPIATADVKNTMRKIENDEIALEQQQGLIAQSNPDGSVTMGSKQYIRLDSRTGIHSADMDRDPLTEIRAVKFTDAFMQKNFGDQEPMRIRYANQVIDQNVASLPKDKQLESITIPEETRTVFSTLGYTPQIPAQLAEKLGPLPTPPIVKANDGNKIDVLYNR